MMRTIRSGLTNTAQLNFKHLRYFLEVARRGNLTRAARDLCVSQSALSTQIRLLERSFGRPLFERVARRLVLTELGVDVLEYAEQIFSLGHDLVTAVHTGCGPRVEHLRIGAVATLSRNFLENLLRSVLGNSQVRLSLVSGTLKDLLEQLHVHALEIVFSNRPVIAEGGRPWRCVRIDRQTVCLVGPQRAPANRIRRATEIAGMRVVVPGPSSDIRSQFDLWCKKMKIQVDIAAEVDDMAMLRLLARDSGEVTILPEVVVQDELRGGRLQRYCAVPTVFENFYAITVARKNPMPLVERLLHLSRASRNKASINQLQAKSTRSPLVDDRFDTLTY